MSTSPARATNPTPAMRQIEVQIMSQSYLLACPAGGEVPFRAAVERVDAAMCRIRDAGKVRARERIAVLAALNLAFELTQLPANSAAPEAAALAGAAIQRTASAGSGGHADDTARIDPERAALLLDRLDQALAGDGHLL